jgi:ATP-dependent helicase/nuclease subunit A
MTTLPDQPARELIRDRTDKTLFVEAGAGSGKTKSLVDRVVKLVLVDGRRLANIAAVTFTEKAGAELRDRLRAEFEPLSRGDDERAKLARQALEDLDSAAIGTLHSFAQRVLTMFPIESGLPPLVEVLDEVASTVAFEVRWAETRAALLDSDGMADTLLLAMSAGVTLEHLRSLMRAFGSDWDLIEDKVLSGGSLPLADVPNAQPLVDEAERLVGYCDECSDPNDKFFEPLVSLGAWGRRLAAAADAGQRLEVLVQAEDLKWGYGKTANWGGRLNDIKDECKALQARAKALVDRVNDATLRSLAYWLAQQVLAAAEERRAGGRLEFHDLLVLCRSLLRRDPEVRARLQEQWPFLLLDEFQDTDPIQIELAVRIAGGAAAGAPDWHDVEVPPGSLFVVGDPKQSIYRFRRASIETYLDARRRVGEGVSLTTNFRTVKPVLNWVNEVFGRVIEPVEKMQPEYEPLTPHIREVGEGPAVVVLGEEHTGKPSADEVREREAADVASVIAQACHDGWTIREEKTDEKTGQKSEEWRKLQLGDIAILLPSRTSLPFLEDALDAAGLSYRAESSSLVYQAGEVRDLLAAARTVADPSDLLSCVTALRSPLFGCGDDDLWSWKRSGGSFNVLAPVKEDLASHPVAQAVDRLRALHWRSRWMTPSELLGSIIADRRILEVAATGPRARDQWRRLRFVVDQARAWSEVEHGGLRAYLAWAARQGEEASRVAEAVLPETDVDAIRIMTVHAAKGLEFPMVVLSGMSTQPNRRRGVQLLWKPDGYAVKISKAVQTNDFEAVQPVDEQMDAHERRRLLYVATTRARDHLVVSLHRTNRDSNAKVLAEDGAAETASGAVLFAGAPVAEGASSTSSAASPPPEWADWLRELEASRENSRRVPAISASGLEGTEPEITLDREEDEQPAGAAKGQRDVELPSWNKGRYGSAVGRAVHGVLQVVDLATGEGLEEAVSAQCVAEGVMEYADLVSALVRSALDSDVVKRAAERPHWRESYVGMVQENGMVLEGFVDLIYREADGSLVVVDYKTDDVSETALDARAHHYRPQIRAYSTALASIEDQVPAGRLLFLNPTSAVGHDVTPAEPSV